MPNFPPRLDDRNFDNLVAELLARIPAHTPEWTDPRVGDPGRALIELFAWLGDTLLYRANLIPERQRLVFLKLLGMQLRPATAAHGLVSVGFASETAAEPITLRRGARVDGPPTFETRGELTILPVEGRVYAKRRLSEDEAKELAGVVNDLLDLYRALQPGQGAGQAVGYVTEELFVGGAPARSGFDLINGTADKALWIALLARTPALVGSVRAGLSAGGEGQPHRLSLGVVPTVAPIGALAELPTRVPRRMILEVLTAERLAGRHVFSELDVASDTTIGLTGDGVLTAGLAVGSFGVPDNDVAEAPFAGMGGDRPPRIDVKEDADRLVGWLRLRPAEPLTSLSLSWVGINAVEVDNLRSFTNVVVGVGSGRPDQVLSLPARNVDATSISLEVLEEGGGYLPWRRVDDLVVHGRDDRVYVLDSEEGTVRFGDGVRGKLVASGARVRVMTMRAGGGVAGNLPARSLSAITGEDPEGAALTTALQVTQPLSLRGGFDGESLAVAERRIPATLRHRDRAVTEADFRSLAATTPGLRVGRVEVLPRFKPQGRRQNVPGVVSVMGVPASTTAGFRPPAPRPDRHFIETMYANLDPRRMLGTELYVIGPEYVPLSATVGVDLRPGFGVEQTLAAVRLALRAFFWPLAPGGPGNRGWGLGETVVTAHAEVAVARVPGVRALRGVRLFEREDGQWRELDDASDRKQTLQPWQLPELLHVIAVAGQDAPFEIGEAPNPFFDDGIAVVPIPVVPEVC